MNYTLKIVNDSYDMFTVRFDAHPSIGVTNGSFIKMSVVTNTKKEDKVVVEEKEVVDEIAPSPAACWGGAVTKTGISMTSSTALLKRHTNSYVDGAARAELATSMVDVLSQSRGDDVAIWPTYSSGAVLMATNGAGGTTHEVICIRPTVVRGDPLCYRNVGSVTADGLAAALTTKAGADGSTLLDSLAAEVHLLMVRLFTRRLGITDVEPAQLRQRVVDAMRSSSAVDVSCADGGSWSLEWQFTSVGCSLIARISQGGNDMEKVQPTSFVEIPSHIDPRCEQDAHIKVVSKSGAKKEVGTNAKMMKCSVVGAA